MNSVRSFTVESSFYSTTNIDSYEQDSDLRKTYLQSFYTPYLSKYSGGFNLLDSMIVPKPCAFKSANLTSVQYYRG